MIGKVKLGLPLELRQQVENKKSKIPPRKFIRTNHAIFWDENQNSLS